MILIELLFFHTDPQFLPMIVRFHETSCDRGVTDNQETRRRYEKSQGKVNNKPNFSNPKPSIYKFRLKRPTLSWCMLLSRRVGLREVESR